MPVMTPKTLGFPNLIQSITIQVTEAEDAQRCVDNMAIPAEPLAINALPALNPCQPTHKIPAPIAVIVKL